MLLGRDRERRALEQLLESARHGRSGVLALVGETGIGKSTLLDWAAAHAAGMTVLRARGVQSEAQIPFAGLFELLRPALDRLDRIPPPQAAALESALALRPARAEDRFAVGAATLSLLAAHAEDSPLAVLVDDAHWLDGSTGDALLFAARRLLADRVAVVLTVRDGEGSLLDGADLPILRLEGLADESALELLRAERPGIGAEASTRLLRETRGNPLALVELARHPPLAGGPDAPTPLAASVAGTFLRRAAELPERTQALLVLASATDRGELALLARAGVALGFEPAELGPAEEARLVALGDGRVEFSHPLARSAIYGAADPELRRAVHRALAAALPDFDADRRAWHLGLAAVGPDESASSALRQAGARARERSAYEASSAAYERAAQLAVDDAHRGRLLHAAAESAWLGGLAERALSLLDDAAPWAAGMLEHRIAFLRGEIRLRRGSLREAREALLAAAERAADDDAQLAVMMLAEVSLGAFHSADAEAMALCGERALAVGRRSTDPLTRFFAASTRGSGLVLAGRGEQGAAAIREAVSVLEQSEELRSDPRLLAWAGIGPLWLREADAGRELADRATATMRAASAVGFLPHLLTWVGIAQAASDGWVEAQASLDEAIGLARETGQRCFLTAGLARLAWLEARLGRTEAARTHAAESLAIARELDAVLCEIWALAALGDLELGLGNAAAALALLEEQQSVIARHRVADVDLFPSPELVELHLRLGNVEQATALVASYEEAAAAKGQPWALARATRAQALVAADDSVPALFAAALALHERTPDVFERARTLLAYGERLRRSGERTQAREPLREALEVFDDLGAEPWAERARGELAATGETARRRTPTTRDELTPQELQISLLLADGRTTREAAAALFLSPKTIEYHLRNAYRKLAIHSRAELRDALRPGGSERVAPRPVA